jgi:hypothetical protein
LRVNRRKEEEWKDLDWRWLEDVEKDLRKMKVKRWRQKTVDREEWVPVMKGSKALTGVYSQGVSNL